MHSFGSEQRVTAELKPDSHDVTSIPGSEVKVKVSIPLDYAMDVYVAAKDSTSSVAGTIDVSAKISRWIKN